MNNDFPKQPGDWIFSLIPWFIGVVFVGVICIWGFYIFAGIKVYDSVKDCTPEFVSQSTPDGMTKYSMECKK